MNSELISVRLDPVTAAILGAVADSYKMSLHELVSQMLYRDAATMSGWPGQLGAELRGKLREMMYPPTPADDEEIPY